MTDFLANLVSRSSGPSGSVQPRVRGLFEPDGQPAPPGDDITQTTDQADGSVDESAVYRGPLTPASSARQTKSLRPDGDGKSIKKPSRILPVDAHHTESSVASPPPSGKFQLPAAAPEIESHRSVVEHTTQSQPKRSATEPELIPQSERPSGKRPATTSVPDSLVTPQPNRQIEAPPIEPLLPAIESATDPVAPPAPTINVTIGRIEVRAIPPEPAKPRRRASAPAVLSLDEYLRQRSRGER